MSVCTCDMCDTFIDTDYDCGEWDIKDIEGDHYDFVCENCFASCDEFEGVEVEL